MSDQTHIEFLQQAYADNWQQHLISLQSNSRIGWDVCVLTASDEQQARMYRGQLEWRRATGLLPAKTRFLVMADPGGQRIGSGGATLRVLAELAREDETLTNQRCLIIHSGGDSRRLPHCSATGKLFARVPRVLPDGRASTLFDEFLIGLSGLSNASLPPGVLVASGDVLLVFDALQLSFQRGGVIGVAAAAPAEMGLRHGVYVRGMANPLGDSPRVQAYLHKPSTEVLTQWQAIEPDGTVQIDTGLVWMDAATALKLAALIQAEAVAALCGAASPAQFLLSTGLNFYGDLVLPLAQSTTLAAYLTDTSDGPATPEVQKARQVIWQRVRGTPFTAERLQPAMFIHFGTSREYWETVSDPAVRRVCDWVPQAAAWSAAGSDGLTLINAVVEDPPETASHPVVLVVDSRLAGRLTCEGAALVADLDTASSVTLAQSVVISQLPVEGGFVTRVFGLYDDPKRGWVANGTFMNQPWADWLDESGFEPEELWPGIPEAARTLWNACLYPVTEERDESLALSLSLQNPAQAPAEWRAKWRTAARLSLAGSFRLADGEQLLRGVRQIEDEVAARRFYAAVKAEEPAVEARRHLGAVASNIERRCEVVAGWLRQADPLLRLRGFQALAMASGQEEWSDAAFASLARLIEEATPQVVPTVGKYSFDSGHSTRVAAAARIDFGGGWTDTPPYSLECGGTVLNAAITLRGIHPIVAEVVRLSEPRFILNSADIGIAWEPERLGELWQCDNPADPFALHKAALMLKGMIPVRDDPDRPLSDLCCELGGGVKLSTQTSIPRGSGLGTSSILAGAVLQSLSHFMGLETTRAQLFDEVLCLEQMLTTGGGWQDQVGGLWGGVKLITTAPGLPQAIHIEPVVLTPAARSELTDRLVLVYTGRQRLAKGLLRAVMSRWMERDPEMVWIQWEIARLAVDMRQALEAGELDRFGELLHEHWTLNKRMDPGCTNPFIDRLFMVMEPFIVGGKLAGAGGGGFAIVVLRHDAALSELQTTLALTYQGTPVAIWPCAIPDTGMVEEQLTDVE